MIRRHIFMSAAAATVMLSSCSGGNDANPTPTPTATATPTPTPTASPTYAAFPLTAAAEFFTTDATTSFTGDIAGATALTLGVSSTERYTDRVRLATSNAITTATTNYVVREATEESRFVPANLTTPSATGNTQFVFRTDDTTTAGKFSQLEFLNNTITGTVTSDPLLGSLTRVSYANWYRGDSTAGQKRLTYTVFGYPTTASDLPTTGTQSYTVRVTGRAIHAAAGANSVNVLGGTATVTVNFATGLVDVAFVLTPTGGGANYVFSAQGAIPVGTSQFSGSITAGSPLGVSGTIAGAFFGSTGTEIGLTFSGGVGSTDRLIGTVVGKKTVIN